MNNNIHRTLSKVYLLHKKYNSKHSVGVGVDLSRPYIIHNPTNTPQGLFSA